MKRKILYLMILAAAGMGAVRASAQDNNVTVIVPATTSVQIATAAVPVPAVPPAVVIQATPPAVPGAAPVIDAFDTNAWVTAAAEGADVTLELVPGAVGQALKVNYDLTGPGGWVSIGKDVSLPTAGYRAVQFQHQVFGNRTDYMEVKLLADDGAIYSNKFPLGDSPNWQTKEVRLDEFRNLDRLDGRVNGIRRVEMLITGDEGSRKSVVIDELKLIP